MKPASRGSLPPSPHSCCASGEVLATLLRSKTACCKSKAEGQELEHLEEEIRDYVFKEKSK